MTLDYPHYIGPYNLFHILPSAGRFEVPAFMGIGSYWPFSHISPCHDYNTDETGVAEELRVVLPLPIVPTTCVRGTRVCYDRIQEFGKFYHTICLRSKIRHSGSPLVGRSKRVNVNVQYCFIPYFT